MRGCCEAVDAGIVVVEEISMPLGACVCGVGRRRICVRGAQAPSYLLKCQYGPSVFIISMEEARARVL